MHGIGRDWAANSGWIVVDQILTISWLTAGHILDDIFVFLHLSVSG